MCGWWNTKELNVGRKGGTLMHHFRGQLGPATLKTKVKQQLGEKTERPTRHGEHTAHWRVSMSSIITWRNWKCHIRSQQLESLVSTDNNNNKKKSSKLNEIHQAAIKRVNVLLLSSQLIQRELVFLLGKVCPLVVEMDMFIKSYSFGCARGSF